MRKYISLFFSVSFFFISCQGTPDGIIKPKQMTALLIQVHIVDGSMMNMMQVPDTLYKYGMGKYMAVFKEFHTDTNQFKKSYKYYTMHPEELTTIYDSVMKRMRFKRDSLTALVAIKNGVNPRKVMSTARPIVPGVYVVPHTSSPVRPIITVNRSIFSNHELMKKERAKRDSILKSLKRKNALSKYQRR